VQSERLDTEYTPVVTTSQAFMHNVPDAVSLGMAALSHRKLEFSGTCRESWRSRRQFGIEHR